MFVLTTFSVALVRPGAVPRFGAGLVPFICLVFSAIFLQVYMSSKGAPIYMYLGLLGALATTCGAAVGYNIYDRISVLYWLSASRASYTDVVPSNLGASYADAASLTFSQDARVDLRRVLGFRNWDGDSSTYCVAPVLDRTLVAESGEVQYWAVGTDCCGPSWGFRCGAVLNPAARSGLVISRGAGSRRAAEKYHRFQLAAHQAGAMYGIRAADEPVFVRWSEDATAAIGARLDMAVLWATLTSLLYFMLSLLVAGCLHWRSGYRKQDWQQAQPSFGSLY